MSDNFLLKDANQAPFNFRSKDMSAAQDGSVQQAWHKASPYPVDYGSGGAFHMTSKSGSMAAGLAAASPIYAFRWSSAAMLAVVKRIRIQAWVLGTAFSPAGLATFDLMRASAWTVADTGGVTDTITGDNGNLRRSMPASLLPELRHSSTAALVAGTRTLDSQPMETLVANTGAAVSVPILSPTKLFEKIPGEHPLVLAQNEGFVIQVTMPATGVWAFAVTPEWDEVALY